MKACSMSASADFPNDVQFRTTIHVAEGAKDEQNHYNGEAELGGKIRVNGISEEEAAAPHDARGVNFHVVVEFSWNKNAGGQLGHWEQDAHRKEALPDYLGVPLLSPEYAFGLRPAFQPDTSGDNQEGADKNPLPTIATVSTSQRVYNITLVGSPEALDGLLAYHLRLQQLRDPTKYRLRELWIDVYNFAVLKLVTQGNFTRAPMNAVPWVVTFQNIGGATYIDTEQAAAPLAFRQDRTFTAATITFTDIREADSRLPMLPFMDSGEILREP
jgi:hypothetical protein